MILNSKYEFNRCHIPRLVVEKEDEQVTLKRLEQERRDREELDNALNNMDLSWE